MAAPMKNVFRDFGQNFHKFQIPFVSDLTQRQIILCRKCSSIYLFGSKHFKALRRGYLSESSVVHSATRTSLERGGKSSAIWNSDSASNDSYTYWLYCRSSGTNSLIRQKLIYDLQCRSVSSVTQLLSVKRENVSLPDKAERDLKENIKTVPNILTLGRILCTPVIGYLVVEQSFTWALGLFICAGITDMLDGVIARNFKNQMSALGTALDPLADKILITVLTVTLTTANLLPVPLAVLIIGRDVFLVAAGFYLRFISLPPPRTLSRYFDVTNPTAKLMPSTLSKINTILQLVLVSATLAAPVFNFVDHPALQAFWCITGATTFCSGVGYVWSRNSYVKFLRKGMERKF